MGKSRKDKGVKNLLINNADSFSIKEERKMDHEKKHSKPDRHKEQAKAKAVKRDYRKNY